MLTAALVLTATLPALVGQVAIDSGIPVTYAYEIVRLESRWNPMAMGDLDLLGGPSVGLFQFRPATWVWARREMGLLDDQALRVVPEEAARTWAYLVNRGLGRWWSTHEQALSISN